MIMYRITRVIFLFFFFNRFVNAQVYFGVSLGSVLLGGNMYLNFFLTSLVEIPGNAFAIYAMNRLVCGQLTENLFKQVKTFLCLQGCKHVLSTNHVDHKI